MENEILLEGKKETRELFSHLVKFYEHTGKWKFNSSKQSKSWLTSIYEASEDIRRLQKVPSTYKTFDINQELNNINNVVMNRLVAQNNDVTKFNMIEIYDYFSTLDSIVDRNHLNNFLSKYLQNHNLHLK